MNVELYINVIFFNFQIKVERKLWKEQKYLYLYQAFLYLVYLFMVFKLRFLFLYKLNNWFILFSNGVLVANEVMKKVRWKKKSGILINMYYEKSFRWEFIFIYYTFEKLEFFENG